MPPEKKDEMGEEEKGFMEELGLEEESEEEGKKEEESKEEEGKEEEETQEEEVAELDARAEEVGLKAGSSLEDVEAAELLVRAEAVGLDADATLEEIEAAEEEAKTEIPEKDLTQEEIDKLPKDAKGLYYALKKEREKRKTAESEAQFLKLREKYKPKEDKPKEEEEEEIEDIDKILAGKADDDVLSAGDVKRILAAQKKVAEKKEKKATDAKRAIDAKAKKMDELEDAFKIDHSDYTEMLNVFARACQEMPSLGREILAEASREDGNPAKRAYELGKKFQKLYGETGTSTPKDTGSARRILKNAEKKKSSASIAGSSISNEELEEMDADELGKTLSAMSMSQFMKVPKKIRERAMR